ncbi:hypothetical protein RHSIM_Rhsim08G0112700 [Rhododendron simsii]|uniref:Myb/SANT-like domain-containing protein n=1 Tax=Rhododendron simsii TaxID=118357 RepID=A0A834GJH3_RHOSS|nr:hypothetical protein RHSIM_Rhsim08G0112700 [Rhododendron simsii]
MANNEVMEVSGESCDSPWPTRNEQISIRLMDEEVKSKKSRETGTFTGEAWKRIKSELKMLTAYDYTNEQVKRKYFTLRILFNSFNSLKANSGVGWDSTLLTIIAPNVVWKRLFKTKPKAKNKTRDSIVANISSALSIFAENRKRRVDVMEKKLHCSHLGCSGVSESMTIGEMGIGALVARMKECQALLNTMEDLDEDSYNKVLEKLHGDVL